MISENQVNRRKIFTEKNALFLKSINNIVNEISKIINTTSIRHVTRSF